MTEGPRAASISEGISSRRRGEESVIVNLYSMPRSDVASRRTSIPVGVSMSTWPLVLSTCTAATMMFGRLDEAAGNVVDWDTRTVAGGPMGTELPSAETLFGDANRAPRGGGLGGARPPPQFEAAGGDGPGGGPGVVELNHRHEEVVRRG